MEDGLREARGDVIVYLDGDLPESSASEETTLTCTLQEFQQLGESAFRSRATQVASTGEVLSRFFWFPSIFRLCYALGASVILKPGRLHPFPKSAR
jgi:hypothetical protein